MPKAQKQYYFNHRPSFLQAQFLSASSDTTSSIFHKIDPRIITHLQLEKSEFDAWFNQFSQQVCSSHQRLMPAQQPQQLALKLLENQQIRELAAFAAASYRSASAERMGQEDQSDILPTTEIEADPRCIFWEVGWWDRSWSDPKCQQVWRGDPECFDYLTFDLAIERLIDEELISPEQRSQVEAMCQDNGEYWHGDENEAGWMIAPAESQPVLSNPNAPLWLLIDWGDRIGDSDEVSNKCDAAILESFRADWLDWNGRILLRHQTLEEILSFVIPGKSWEDHNYQRIWIERIAVDGDNSYTYRSQWNRRMQISREQSLTEAKEHSFFLL